MENQQEQEQQQQQYVYYKTKFQYKGFDVYHREIIDTIMHEATIFNDKYIYYYKSDFTEKPKLLGKYKGKSIRSSNMRWDDYDYNVYEFINNINNTNEIEDVICTAYNYIYAVGIPESAENLNLNIIDEMFYEGNQCFMKIV